MKKILFIIILILTVLINISSEENNKFRAVEFNIGGGFNLQAASQVNNYFSHNEEFELSEYYSGTNSDIEYNEGQFFPIPLVFITLPTNLTFYINKYFGIGIFYSLAFSIVIFPFPEIYWINNKFGIAFKTGNILKGKALLIELGAIIKNYLVPFYYYYPNNQIRTFAGITLLLGYEFCNKNRFAFTVAGNFDSAFHYTGYNYNYMNTHYSYSSLFGYSSYTTMSTVYRKDFTSFICFGIELRWRYSLLKEF